MAASNASTSGAPSWKFQGLTFEAYGTGRKVTEITMSRDLAVAIQGVRSQLGPGNVVHVGVWRNRPNQRSQYTGKWQKGPPWTGHYFGDAIDLKSWGDHTYDEMLAGCRRVPGLRVVDERGISVVHIEVNHPHNNLNSELAEYFNRDAV